MVINSHVLVAVADTCYKHLCTMMLALNAQLSQLVMTNISTSTLL